jgi:hypothetical protein
MIHTSVAYGPQAERSNCCHISVAAAQQERALFVSFDEQIGKKIQAAMRLRGKVEPLILWEVLFSELARKGVKIGETF